MGRHKDSGRIDLATVFLRVQREMLAHLAVDRLFEHASAAGAATEQHWIQLFNRYLPRRYRASSAFVVDADGRRSRQIDIAIYDNLYSPLLFPHDSGLHIPAESVYAVFEVKQELTKQWLQDAGEKAASVRALRRTSAPVLAAGRKRQPIAPKPILAGILTVSAVWRGTFRKHIPELLCALSATHHLDLGCALQHGAFELAPRSSRVRLSAPGQSLIFFMLRLLARLQSQGTAPALDLSQYSRSLTSFSE